MAGIEKLRKHLKIGRWVVFGGSWCSTLALAYTQIHSDRISSLILCGISLCRDHDLTRLYQEGASCLLPNLGEYFLVPITAVVWSDLV